MWYLLLPPLFSSLTLSYSEIPAFVAQGHPWSLNDYRNLNNLQKRVGGSMTFESLGKKMQEVKQIETVNVGRKDSGVINV